MLYDNVVVTATKPAAKLSRQKSTSAHIERHSNASDLPGQGSTDFATFEKAVEKDPSYQRIRHNSPDFEYASTRDDLVKIWSQHFDYAQDAEVQFERRGKTRRALKQTTEFLNTFKSYMDAYGGVVELMASAGGGYGQTAYSTMSIFLTIASNKQDRDDKISETLKKLCKLYSRFPTLERIHPSPEMRGCIEEAYRIGIDFARYASLYYLRSSIGRLWDVMCNPPEMFEETLREITDTVQDIRDEAAFRDSERLHRVEATMKQNQARLEASQKQVQDAQRAAQLEFLREKILPNYPCVTQETSEYQKRLDAMFDGQRRDLKGRLPQLRQTKEVQGWQARKKPSILVLRGEARQETHFSWFSPLVMALCRDYQRERTAVAFHCCQPLDNSAKGHRLVEVLNHLSFQLLHTSTRPLGLNAYQSIRDTSSQPEWGKDQNLAMSVLTEIIRNLDTVTLIVDRADLIRGDWEENLILLCQLTSRSMAQSCNVKLIVVGSRVQADWRDVQARMRDFVGAEGVFEITSAEGDWDP